MTRNPVVVSPEDSVGDAIAKMSRGGYRRLPIVNRDGVPTGVLVREADPPLFGGAFSHGHLHAAAHA